MSIGVAVPLYPEPICLNVFGQYRRASSPFENVVTAIFCGSSYKLFPNIVKYGLIVGSQQGLRFFTEISKDAVLNFI